MTDKKSKCCRQSLSCGGAMLMVADGGKPICQNCLVQLADRYDQREAKVVWTPALLAEALENKQVHKTIDDLNMERGTYYSDAHNTVKADLKEIAKLLRGKQ